MLLGYVYSARLLLQIFNKSIKHSVGWVSDSVTQHNKALSGYAIANPTYIDFSLCERSKPLPPK